MTWLSTTWKALATALLAALAVFAIASATRQKGLAKKWQDTAVAEKEKDVEDSVGKAKAAWSQAKLANARAKEKKESARRKLDAIGKKDPELAAIVNSWRSSRLRNSSGG